MAENPSESLERTIGVIQATVNDLKKRFEDFGQTLRDIKTKLGDKLDESLKLGTENSYNIRAQKIEIDDLKIDNANIKLEIKEEKNRKNNWWGNLTNRIIGAILVAVILSVAAFYAGEYKQTLKYQTPPNHVAEQSN